MIGDSNAWATLAAVLDTAGLGFELRTRIDNLVVELVHDERHDVLESLALATVTDDGVDDFVRLPGMVAPMPAA